jgi:hypothetical protein
MLILMLLWALAAILAGCAQTIGAQVMLDCVGEGCTPTPPGAATVSPRPTLHMPESDAAGADFADLPRFPGALRAAYEQSVTDNLLVTMVEYVVPAEIDWVHGFYRGVFSAEGWFVGDMSFEREEWMFLLLSGEREALVRIGAQGPLVTVAIEVSEPLAQGASGPALDAPHLGPRVAPAHTATPTPTLAPTPLPTQAPTQAPVLVPVPTQAPVIPTLPPDDSGGNPGGNGGSGQSGGDDGNDDDDGDDDDGDDDDGDDDDGDDDDGDDDGGDDDDDD